MSENLNFNEKEILEVATETSILRTSDPDMDGWNDGHTWEDGMVMSDPNTYWAIDFLVDNLVREGFLEHTEYFNQYQITERGRDAVKNR